MPIVKRYFELIEPAGPDGGAQSLSSYMDRHAVVVLGGPGLGKTTEFEQASSIEDNAVCFNVSDFLHEPNEALQGKTIYLDALDEHRAEIAGQSVMSAIIGKLRSLDSPKVRMSCRTTEWHEGSDVRALSRAAADEPVYILDLQPLSPGDVEIIAAEQINNVEAFLDGARQRGLGETLSNPENLKLYLKVYKDSGGWPETRTELLEQSTKLLLGEKNEQHARVHGDKLTDERLMAAAEDLSAIHVFSNTEGLSLSKVSGKDAGYVPIQELTHIDHDAASIAARRKLFASTMAECVKPQHKMTGDFLAAKALARRIISSQLSLGRALSLVLGKDGGTLSHLRDVYAWLIALLPQHGDRLLLADPFGAMIYGDVAQWPDGTKIAALSALREHATNDDPWFRAGQWHTPSLGGLACAGMASEFRQILHNEDDAHLVSVVLTALEHGSQLPELGDDLLVFIHDTSRPEMSRLKDNALSAFANNCPERIGELRTILDEVHSGKINDDDLALRAELLRQLYPGTISPNQAVEYFVSSRHTTLTNFRTFIRHQLLDQTPDSALPALAQGMINRPDKMEELSDFDTRHVVGALVVRLLTQHGDRTSLATIYDWLGLYLDKHGHAQLDKEHAQFIKAYIEERKLYKALFRHWFAHAEPSKDGSWSAYKFGYRVLHADQPKDFCITLLTMAEGETIQSKADMLFTEASSMVVRAEPRSLPVALEDLFDFVDQNSRFQTTLEIMLRCNLFDRYFEYKQNEHKHRDGRVAKRTANVTILIEQLDALREGRSIQNLDLGARYWFGYSNEADRDNPPFERISKSTNEKIASAMVSGFEILLNSADQHTPLDIAKLNARSRRYHVTFPILAGADIVAERSLEDFLELPDESLKAALAYRLLWPADRHKQDWDDWVYAYRPDLGKAVLGDIWQAELAAGKTQHLTGLYVNKTEEPNTPLVLSLITKMLREDPALPPKILREMLTILLQHGDPEPLRVIAFNALENNMLRGEKHTLWLALATLFDPETYAERLGRKICRNTRDMWSAYHVLLAGASTLLNGMDGAPILQAAISILGKMYRNVSNLRTGYLRRSDADEDAAREIRKLISSLSGLPTIEAARAFKQLCVEPSLHEWHDHLRHARAEQAKNMRDKTFAALDVQQVCNLLADGAPANMQDLQAITLDILDDIAPTIHGTNTNRWKYFWRLAERGKPDAPRIEDDCRDPLLDLMRPAVQARGILSDPEARAANNKRVDIRLTARNIGTLPIEIKREDNSEVWTSMGEQLVEKYANDPATNGYGIFLVLWFGGKNLAAVPKELGITKPKTIDELRATLEVMVPNDRIVVRVLDVSNPK
ncbi:MAG: hypothetical protein NUV50_00320 [Rhodospirillales bacterium]|nr:hypothetical protein [Rhodospirillales bacterium]